MQCIDADQIVLSTDCGFGRQGCNRMIAFHKTVSMVQGANIVRNELGSAPARIRAEEPRLQIDNLARAHTEFKLTDGT